MQPIVGTQAFAMDHMTKNRKHFKYPKEGFITPIEHSLLYSMINTGLDIYPKKVILQHIDEEDFSVYLNVKSTKIENEVSYSQLCAILSLSIEKFPPQYERYEQSSISQNLCKKLLSCITKYAEEHDLDRQAEIKDFLDPVERHTTNRTNKDEAFQFLTVFAGYTATFMTLNPIPMVLGLSVMTARVDNVENQRMNLDSIKEQTNRRADVEKTSLLDEQNF